jgi:hypothetical protein
MDTLQFGQQPADPLGKFRAAADVDRSLSPVFAKSQSIVGAEPFAPIVFPIGDDRSAYGEKCFRCRNLRFDGFESGSLFLLNSHRFFHVFFLHFAAC